MKIFIMNRYIFSKSHTTSKNTIDRKYTERGRLQCQLLLVLAKDAEIMASKRYGLFIQRRPKDLESSLENGSGFTYY